MVILILLYIILFLSKLKFEPIVRFTYKFYSRMQSIGSLNIPMMQHCNSQSCTERVDSQIF